MERPCTFDGKGYNVPQHNEESQPERTSEETEGEVGLQVRQRRYGIYRQLLVRREDEIEQLKAQTEALRAANHQLELELRQKCDIIAFLEDEVLELTDRVTALSLPMVTGPDAT